MEHELESLTRLLNGGFSKHAMSGYRASQLERGYNFSKQMESASAAPLWAWMTANGNGVLVTAQITWQVAVKFDFTSDWCPSRIPACSGGLDKSSAFVRLATGFGRVII